MHLNLGLNLLAYSPPQGGGPPATIGGVAIGQAGAAGTIYETFRLAGGEEFNILDLYTPSNPAGKYIPSHRRRGRRAINSGSNDYYWTPEHTGYQDALRGQPIGSGVDDLMSVSASVLAMATRLATTQEKDAAWLTSASTGPKRPQSASALHSAGYQAVKWPCVIEARMKLPTGAQIPAGGWPAFWTENVLPTWANTGEFDFEWVDNGDLYTNFITGTSENDPIGSVVVDTSDGQWHTFSMVVEAATIKFYKDGTLLSTAVKRPDAHVNGPMFWWFRIGVDLTPGIYGMTYNAADWTGVTTTMEIDWVRLWTKPTATDLGYKGTVATINVDFDGSINETLPSRATLWGAAAASVTEYLIFQPVEGAEPGISQVPETGAPNTWYGQTSARSGLWGPTFLNWNPTTRALTGSGFDRAGRLVGHIVAWDDTNGGLAGFARVVINVGPRVTAPTLSFANGATVSYDLYAACDCGHLLPKTINVSGLAGSGLSFNASTGLLTGTFVAGNYTMSVTVTNSLGQSESVNVSIAGQSYAYEAWTGPGWFDFSNATTVTLNGSNQVTAVSNKRAGSGDLAGEGTITLRTLPSSVQNGFSVLRLGRDTANPARLRALTTAALSSMFNGNDKPYTVISVYIPRDANSGFIWSASDTVDVTNSQCVGLISRSTPNSSVRRQVTTVTNDVNFGSGQASGTPRIVAVKHSGTAVTIWDTSLTKAVDAAAQDTTTFNNELAFYLGAFETGGASDPTIGAVAKAVDICEIVVESSARSDADIQQAITDLAAKWGITLS